MEHVYYRHTRVSSEIFHKRKNTFAHKSFGCVAANWRASHSKSERLWNGSREYARPNCPARIARMVRATDAREIP